MLPRLQWVLTPFFSNEDKSCSFLYTRISMVFTFFSVYLECLVLLGESIVLGVSYHGEVLPRAYSA